MSTRNILFDDGYTPTGPTDDPQDHYCKSVCGRIAGGLVMETPIEDLREVRRWLDDIIEHRDSPPLSVGFKPY